MTNQTGIATPRRRTQGGRATTARRLRLTACAILTATIAAAGPPAEYRTFGAPSTDSDGEAIEALMERFGRAWGSQDVEGSVGAYSQDAEWINAFGDVRRGHSELRDQFAHLFERFESGSDPTDGPEEPRGDVSDDTRPRSGSGNRRGGISLRYIGSDAAVLVSYVESDWGENRDDGGARRVFMTFVLEKRQGEWRIVHHMIMDARR